MSRARCNCGPPPFSLRAALEDCTALFLPVAEAKGLDIDLDVDPQLPDAVVGDSFRLRQALGNLVSNAVKFTELGRVRVCVGPAERKPASASFGSSDALCLRILVQDTGPGLPLEDAERIFESFQRGSDASSAPGTGLGLYIARTIARRMGGDVTVTSAPGRGSCFALEVCLQLPGSADGKKSGSRPGCQAATVQAGACAVRETASGTVVGAAGAAVPPSAVAVPSGSSAGSDWPAAPGFAAEPEPPAGPARFTAPPPALSPFLSCSAECALADAATDPAAGPAANAAVVPAADEDGEAAPESETGCFAGRRILVAEDNEANRYIMEHMLRAEGACVCMARDGKAALAALAQGPWDLVILDARMPDMSGLDVLQAVRLGHAAVPALQKTVIYTAALDAEDRRRCKDLGADLVLLKPLTFAVLRKKLASLLRAEDRARATSSADAPGKEALALWNRQAAMDALDDDLQLLMRLAGVLRGDLRVRDAELEAALAAGDDACLRRLGHAVKNSAGTMRFDVLRERACHVEQAQKTDIGQAVTEMRAALREALDMLDKELDDVNAMPGKTLVPGPVPGSVQGPVPGSVADFAAGTAPAGCKGGC